MTISVFVWKCIPIQRLPDILPASRSQVPTWNFDFANFRKYVEFLETPFNGSNFVPNEHQSGHTTLFLKAGMC